MTPTSWFATGGRAGRVFHSPDRGRTWQVFDTPIAHGPDSAGIFSIAFRDATHGIIAGGDYQRPSQDGPNLAFTSDGGHTWTLAPFHPEAYYSAAAFERNHPDHILIVAPDSIVVLSTTAAADKTEPPGLQKFPGLELNALSPYPEDGALFVGPNGCIASFP
jgi:photosystem II stability/assembly factor-like uncharacterized protein